MLAVVIFGLRVRLRPNAITAAEAAWPPIVIKGSKRDFCRYDEERAFAIVQITTSKVVTALQIRACFINRYGLKLGTFV
jgi:hypothetical protein